VSLFINIIECKRSWNRVVTYPICWSVCRSVGLENVLWHNGSLWMPFGVVSGIGQGMGVLYGWCLQCYCLQCFDAVGWVAGRASGL